MRITYHFQRKKKNKRINKLLIESGVGARIPHVRNSIFTLRVACHCLVIQDDTDHRTNDAGVYTILSFCAESSSTKRMTRHT